MWLLIMTQLFRCTCQVADLLRQQIKDGALAARLPSVKSLSQEHGVSHITAEKALAVLKMRGSSIA